MTTVIVMEKPSAAKHMEVALGGKQGVFAGEPFKIVSLRGHLFEFEDPAEMLRDPAKKSKYKQWSLDSLPWDPDDFTWERKPRDGVSGLLADLRRELKAADVIANGADMDPTGEGDLLFWEVIDELGLHDKDFVRLEFVDESVASLQKAFVNRRQILSMQDEGAFRKADARSKMDLLTMQHTRIATVAAAQRAVLRQGRLKSAMVTLVGDQQKAHEDYVKKPFFQNRFRDENGVVYISPDEPRFATEAEVPQSYGPGTVEVDSKTRKTTAPPRLLDLASLSALLAAKGFKAQAVLATYQKMYEDQVVSYPRTEDKTITGEQFKELLPLADRIAGVVGVDPGVLGHRSPRPTHVKDTGAHGANRPGPNVPQSLDSLGTKYGNAAPHIYEALARSYLAMLADDYAYERQEGHVREHPSFKGAANVPLEQGWKDVYPDKGEADDDESQAGLGTRAEPFVHEGANPRPPRPTMKWLMAQLAKRDVGTGATRTTIYADVTNERHKFPLISESRGRLEVTEHGRMSYMMLAGTRIGDLGATEQFYAMMKDIEAGTRTTDDALSLVTGWVEDDKERMQRNAAHMMKELGLSEQRQAKEKAEGTWRGQDVKFSREWGGHRFTDAEVAALLRGEEIEVLDLVSKAGNKYGIVGKLSEQQFTADDGRVVRYVGFERLRFADRKGVPDAFCKHTFTAEEKQKLEAGEKIFVKGMVSKKGKQFDATMSYGKKEDGTTGLILDFG